MPVVQVHPTRAAVDLALAATLCLFVGILAGQAPVVAFGGALLVGVAAARAVTRVGVTRIRAAGLEMLWHEEARAATVSRGESLTITAEIRNRDTRAARFSGLCAISSPNLQVRIEPSFGEVPASGRLLLSVEVQAHRVGQHGLFGLSLEVQGSPGLFEVPLTFASPFGFRVMPRPFATLLRSARGGRSRSLASEGRHAPFPGDGTDLRELRALAPGDPFKRIAWKASARRGQLLVREFEREERDTVWLFLDASVELWAGEPGHAPLDHAIDELAAVAQHHLGRGDQVGLAILAGQTLSWLPPARGLRQLLHILDALALGCGTLDTARSDWDEQDVAARVLEHIRPLDPAGTAQLRSRDIDKIARRARRLEPRAPFQEGKPQAPTERERTLRRHLAIFGISSPPRLEPERQRTDQNIVAALSRLRKERKKASVVYIWSEAPEPGKRPELSQALLQRRQGFSLRWVSMRTAEALAGPVPPAHQAAYDAVRLRTELAVQRGERALGRLGVRVLAVRPRRSVPLEA